MDWTANACEANSISSHSVVRARWRPLCLSLTSSHHPELACLCPSLWSYICSLHACSFTSMSLFLIDSRVVLLVLCQHCLCFPSLRYSSYTYPLPPPTPRSAHKPLLLCHWDYSGWQSLAAESLVAEDINIYMNTKASSGLFVCFCLIEASAKI